MRCNKVVSSLKSTIDGTSSEQTLTWDCGPFKEYRGQLKDGKFNGNGILTYTDGRTEVGFFVNGYYIGKVTFIDKNGREMDIPSIDGAFDHPVKIERMCTEEGRIYKTIYRGTWYNGFMNGYGKLESTVKAPVEGFFLNDEYLGQLWGISEAGKRYKIDFKHNKFNGKVHITYPKGEEYEGGWKDGYREGEGRFINAQHVEYFGQWSNNKREGHGIIDFHTTGVHFDGFFKDDMYDGKGKFTYPDGSFTGYFSKNLREGVGKLRYPDKTICEGTWIHNKREGEVFFKFKDGSEFKGLFENDLLYGSGEYHTLAGSFYVDNLENFLKYPQNYELYGITSIVFDFCRLLEKGYFGYIEFSKLLKIYQYLVSIGCLKSKEYIEGHITDETRYAPNDSNKTSSPQISQSTRSPSTGYSPYSSFGSIAVSSSTAIAYRNPFVKPIVDPMEKYANNMGYDR